MNIGYLMSSSTDNTDWIKLADPASAMLDLNAVERYWQTHSAAGEPMKAYTPNQERWPAGTPGGLGGQFRPKVGGAIWSFLNKPEQAGTVDISGYAGDLWYTKWQNDDLAKYSHYTLEDKANPSPRPLYALGNRAAQAFVEDNEFSAHSTSNYSQFSWNEATEMKDSLARKNFLAFALAGEYVGTDKFSIRTLSDTYNFPPSYMPEADQNQFMRTRHVGMFDDTVFDLSTVDIEPGAYASKIEKRVWKEQGRSVLGDYFYDTYGPDWATKKIPMKDFVADLESDSALRSSFMIGHGAIQYDAAIKTWTAHSWARAWAIKGPDAKYLQKAPIYSYGQAAGWIKGWAISSNDSNLQMLETQRIAGAMMGRKPALSEWQATSYDQVMDERKEMHRKHAWNIGTMTTGNSDTNVHPRQMFPNEFSWNPDTDEWTFVQGWPGTPETITRNSLQHMYQRTQNWFKEKGFKPTDKVTIYRGFNVQKGTDFEKSSGQGSIIDTTFNPLESWSLNPHTAADFGGYGGNRAQYVVAMDVPIGRILATPHTGFGCANEYEVILLNPAGLVDSCYVVRKRG